MKCALSLAAIAIGIAEAWLWHHTLLTTILLLIVTDILSRIVSKLSQIILQILDEKRPLCVLSPFGGKRQRTLFTFGALENYSY